MNKTLTPDEWAIWRLVEIRQAGEDARLSIVLYGERSGHRRYRLEIRRANGSIERALWPLPVGGERTEASVTLVEEKQDG